MNNFFGEPITGSYVVFLLFALLFFAYVIYTFINEKAKLTTKEIAYIAIFAALTVVLGKIKLVPFPEGGGITLVQYLPLMVISIVLGRKSGMIAGLVSAIISIIIGVYILYPVQVIFDYIIPPMAISIIMANNKIDKKSLLAKGIIAGLVVIFSYVASGVVFYYDYAPTNMNLLIYSIGYNMFGSGIDYIITLVVLMFMPIKTLKQMYHK